MNNSRISLRTSTSINTMIVALEPIEFIPCGRHSISNHPGLSCLHLHQSQALSRLDRSLIGSFSKVSLDDKKNTETWRLRTFKDAEEELYVCGHTVIWSRGHNVISTFTIDSPITQAVWCSFIVNGEDPHLHELGTDNASKNCKNVVEGFAAVSDGSLHMFSREGDDYVTSLPFKVRKVWNCNFGLIFERSQKEIDSSASVNNTLAESTLPSENALTTVFCLQHPLKEFAPVVKKLQGNVRYMNRSRESIIFCDENFVMTFDCKHGLHTIWKLRKITPDDVGLLENNLNQQRNVHNHLSSIRQMSISSPGTSPMRVSYRGSPAAPILPNITGALPSHTIPVGLARTPHTSRNPSFAHLSHTPNSSRLCSPSATSINYPSHAFSPLRNSPHLVRSPSTPISHESLCLNDSVHESAEPLRPEICFEHVWSENVVGTREGSNIGMATKAFLSEDVCGQNFMAYIIDNVRQLRLVKYGLSNDQSQFIFGAVVSLPARDAAPLKELKMIAVLDMVGAITLYTGIVKLVKMHVTGVPMSSLSLSHGLRNATPALGTPQPVSTPAHPSRPGSALGNIDEVGHLSPVPELAFTGDTDISCLTDEYPFSSIGQSSSSVMSLPHVVGSTLLLEVSTGAYYKTEVPQLCTTSLVETCMKAMHHVLPNDIYLQITIKWYAMRHCPGAMASHQSEWAIFEACVRDIVGYSSSKRINRSQQMDASVSPVVAAKKARHFGGESSGDWEYLLHSDFHKSYQNNWSQITDYFSTDEFVNEQDTSLEETKFELLNKSRRRSSLDRSSDRTTSSVQPLCAIFCVLHLVYEEQKLNIMTWKNIPMMSKFLFRIANDIGLKKFSQWYAIDNPDLIQDMPTDFKEYDPQIFRLPACFSSDLEPNIFVNFHKLLQKEQSNTPFPVISGVTDRTKQLLTIYDCLFKNENCTPSTTELGHFTKTSTFKKDKSIEMEDDFLVKDEKKNSSTGSAHSALKYMMKVGMTNEALSTIPHGVALPIHAALHQCKEFPDLNFSNKALELIGRSDLLKQNSPEMAKWQDSPLSACTDPKRSAWQPNSGVLANNNESDSESAEREIVAAILENDHAMSSYNNIEPKTKTKTQNKSSESADDNVTRLLFPNDHRISEVRRLLQSSKPVRIDLTQQPGVSDHEFNEQLKTRLLQICNRTMSLAVGRGMVSLQTEKPVPTEPFQIPSMDLTGRCLPSNTSVDLEGGSVDIPANMKDWPSFHNGVAAGLKIMPQMDNSSWVYLNKPKSSNTSNTASTSTVELSAEHAGFLLALGLNGHLEKLHTLNIHDYLSRTHEMTTVGLLIGLGASRCGSCDLSTMRLLSVHIPALLPQTSTEFDLPRVVQTAAVTAVGFLYLGSAQRLYAEVMLREIDRPPSPENDTGQGREAYALSCGIALGAITLGRGGNIPELADLDIPDQLFHYMTGRRKRSGEATSQSIILEGDQINTEITAPGAIMALTLMFLKTNNAAVADWFAAPETLLLLEAIKPQHLMLRTLARSLILWDCVTPTKEWVEGHIPFVIRAHITSSGDISESMDENDSTVDVQTVLQCHASILTGACLALGIRFAGSQNKTAYETLRHYVLFFLSIWNDQNGRTTSYPLEVMGRYTLETCLTTCLVALSLVVAGSGDMETLQICRFIHVRLDAEVNYGMQMATHMALGFLFLGNCRKTLSTSNKAITALLSAVYPCFPCSSTDNQYHLQALRHFYVLAIEQRLLVPVDSATNMPCYARIGIKLSESCEEDHSYVVMAPCMLPEIKQLKEVTVNDPRHWPLSVDVQTQSEKIQQLLESGLSVQRRTGFQPYIQDPKGHRSLLARSSDIDKFGVRWNSLLTDDNYNTRTFVEAYLDCFYKKDNDAFQLEKKNSNHLFTLLKNFLTEERTQSLHLFCGLQQICTQIQQSNRPNPLAIWQLKIASDFLKQGFLNSPELAKDSMNGVRFIALLSSEIENHFGRFLPKIKSTLLSLLELESSKAANLRPRRSAKRKELTVDFPLVPLNTKLPWTQDVNPALIWSLACFSIYNMLPSDFLYSSKKYDDCGKSFSRMDIMKALHNKGIKASQSTQMFKVFQS